MSVAGSVTTPPSYTVPLSGDGAAPGAADIEASEPGTTSNESELPAYMPSTRSSSTSRRRENPEPKEFSYDVKNRKGKSIAVLIIIAERSYSKHIPTFLQDSPVKGRVHLSLDKPDVIQSVVLSIRGEYITGANPDQQLIFLELSHPLWSQADGDPRSSNNVSEETSSSPRSHVASSSVRFSGKLEGEYTWPFSITLPKEVNVPCGKGKQLQTFTLPQTFNERHAKGSINYEMSLRINRGRFQSDHRIPAKFGYIPISRPPPFPPLRRVSYQEGTTLLGPTIDPEGWYSDNPVTIKGTLFNNRTIHIVCTLCYTRGSLIPLCIRLESDDYQALDLLSTPKAIVVSLKRRIKYQSDPERFLGSLVKDTIDYSQPAVWWPSSEGIEDNVGRFRFLNGELHLKVDMKPTSGIGDFAIEYSVVLFPFKTVGFEPSIDEVLLEYPVGIVTSFSHGPRPRKHAPPGYEADARPSIDFLTFDRPAAN
ncbi:hypothetical protein CVT25_008919 [Psilocybe cyanescens]|uniref:Arrestin-like N-terminal domain-containing protein n=1 Tax=Psilocybe cyanescens TaxID=93625 RepID=A0A409XND9_PSICY|nr:hypothetical protein CVT25_008919 [Psilocybe cyanescens]